MATPAAELNARMSAVDLAHRILQGKGKPLYYRELLDQVLTIKPTKGKDVGHIMASIHTDLNLDGRFVHMGNGVWGLREWVPDSKISDDDDEWDS